MAQAAILAELPRRCQPAALSGAGPHNRRSLHAKYAELRRIREQVDELAMPLEGYIGI
jgi:hypothetical protein